MPRTELTKAARRLRIVGRTRGVTCDGIIIPIVECCIKSREERRKREAHMVRYGGRLKFRRLTVPGHERMYGVTHVDSLQVNLSQQPP